MNRRWLFAGLLCCLLAPAALLAQEEHPPHWDYEGEGGPAEWAELDEDFALCAEGRAQSPINLTEAATVNLSDIEFHYAETPLTVANNGHTIQVDSEAGSSIRYNARDYALLQFHFHHPSEHTVNGEPAPMELHLVHRAGSDDLVVVGVPLTVGDADNAAFAPIFDHLPAEAGVAQDTGLRLSMADLLPAETTFITYSGSLTTPPCSEGVRWLVLDTPVELSEGQIAAFAAIFDGNARPVQPLNGRDVLQDAGATAG